MITFGFCCKIFKYSKRVVKWTPLFPSDSTTIKILPYLLYLFIHFCWDMLSSFFSAPSSLKSVSHSLVGVGCGAASLLTFTQFKGAGIVNRAPPHSPWSSWKKEAAPHWSGEEWRARLCPEPPRQPGWMRWRSLAFLWHYRRRDLVKRALSSKAHTHIRELTFSFCLKFWCLSLPAIFFPLFRISLVSLCFVYV